MAIKKKRTGLDALGLSAEKSATNENFEAAETVKDLPPVEKPAKSKTKAKKDVVQTSVYVPQAVYDQWRELAFTERKKMHDYLIEGLNKVFHNRGLKSVEDLTGE